MTSPDQRAQIDDHAQFVLHYGHHQPFKLRHIHVVDLLFDDASNLKTFGKLRRIICHKFRVDIANLSADARLGFWIKVKQSIHRAV